jgi:hypothetical protein
MSDVQGRGEGDKTRDEKGGRASDVSSIESFGMDLGDDCFFPEGAQRDRELERLS